MAKLHHKSPAGKSLEVFEPPVDSADLARLVETFLRGCGRPAVLEPGDSAIPLLPGSYTLELAGGRLWLEVWDETRSVARRILSAQAVSPGILDCQVHRFGGKPGLLTLLDLNRPQTAKRAVKGARQLFAEQFRRMLSRQFARWEIAQLSSASDLHRTFSSLYPRALLKRGHQRVAALACPAAEEESAFLSAALIWHDHLVEQVPPGSTVSLALFLPEGVGSLTAHRLRWLTGRCLAPRLFSFNADGLAGEVDSQDLGNIETRSHPHFSNVEVPPEFADALAAAAQVPGVGFCPELNGALSIRFQGLEFARVEHRKLLLGIETKAEIARDCGSHLLDFALRLRELSCTAHRASGLPRLPERWLESCVRDNLNAIDPALVTAEVHSQVLTFAAGARELIDLLAITRNGQLTVIELKNDQDVQLPLQALDYWIRIRWHAARGELNALFPSTPVGSGDPKLLLVAPALSFHPANERVLRYFSPSIGVERIGVNSDWQRKLKVVWRLPGAEPPISHRSSK